MTKPISVRLEESVIQLLKDRAKEAGVSQADYLTGLITCGPVIEHVVDTPASSFNDPARAERAQARKERKAALAQSVGSALPQKPETVDITPFLDRLPGGVGIDCHHPARSRTPGSEPKCIDCGKRLKAGVWV